MSRRWAALGVILLGAVVGGYFVKKRIDRRNEEQALADAWDGFRRCMLGDEPLNGEHPFDRARKIQLASQAQADVVPPVMPAWPYACTPFANELEAARDGRFHIPQPNLRHKAEEGSLYYSPYLWPTRQQWEQMWADAGTLAKSPRPRAIVKPPAPVKPLELDAIKPLGPGVLGRRSDLMSPRAHVEIGDRVCAIENAVATCEGVTFRDDHPFANGTTFRTDRDALIVTHDGKSETKKLPLPEGRALVMVADSAYWFQDDSHLAIVDLLDAPPYVGPRNLTPPLGKVHSEACRSKSALFIHGGGIAVRTAAGWNAYPAPPGRLTCVDDRAILVEQQPIPSSATATVRAARCDAKGCREESAVLPVSRYSAPDRIVSNVIGVGDSVALIDDSHGLWIRIAPVTTALPSTTPILVLDDDTNGGKYEAKLREVIPIVGAVVLLIEARGATFGVWLRPDGSFSAITR